MADAPTLASIAVGRNVRQLRTGASLSVTEVARALRLQETELEMLEQGTAPLTMARVELLARALGVQVTELFAVQPQTVAAAAFVQTYLGSPASDADALSGDERRWLESLRGESLFFLGEAPGVDLGEIVRGRRTVTPPASARLRVVIAPAALHACVKLGDAMLISDQGEQELTLRLAYQMARATGAAP